MRTKIQVKINFEDIETIEHLEWPQAALFKDFLEVCGIGTLEIDKNIEWEIIGPEKRIW